MKSVDQKSKRKLKSQKGEKKSWELLGEGTPVDGREKLSHCSTEWFNGSQSGAAIVSIPILTQMLRNDTLAIKCIICWMRDGARRDEAMEREKRWGCWGLIRTLKLIGNLRNTKTSPEKSVCHSDPPLPMAQAPFLENLAIGRLLPLYELLHPNGHSQWIMSLRARNVPDSRPTVWAFFQTNSAAIASRFHCAFHPIQLTDANVEWDAALVSFADRVAWRHNWNPFFEQIRSALAQIESGVVPSDVDPSPYDLPPSDSPPSLGGL
ncbi:hypothetical protein niasHT_013416 [Heterodera trifolii]|uniref:Uncharacterized protein n=1 Tax=Heterodera trifolii TaxID=157864 RepID=A0ABD2LD78_9BILA